MPRQIPSTRIADIARAACKVFTEKGYRRALMTDVGRELGLSHALLYRYVESKEALFQLALLYAIDPATLPTLPVPLPTPRPGDTLTPIAAWMSGNSTFTALGAALSRKRSDDVRREFTAVVDELYSAVETNHVFLALVEASAVDLPELASLYFGQAGSAGRSSGSGRTWRCGCAPDSSAASPTSGWRPGSSWRRWLGSPGTGGTTGPERRSRTTRPGPAPCSFWSGADSRRSTRRDGSRPGMTTAGSLRGRTVPAPSVHRPPGAADLAPCDRRTFVVAGVSFVVLMALAGRYGFHRDELYFLDCARHLSASYVDQPVFTPCSPGSPLSLFGVSRRGPPAVGGPRRRPARCVMAGTAGPGVRRPAHRPAADRLGYGHHAGPGSERDHLFGPTAFDLFFWSALAFLVVRIGRTGNLRLWLPAGLVLGIGLANKHTIGFFAVALVVGTLLSGGWRLIANRWCLLGAGVAAVFTVPDLWWQATHHWATIAMTRALNQENGGVGHIATWFVGQFLVAALALAWVWPARPRIAVESRPTAVASPGLGVRPALRALRPHDRREGLLPRRCVCVSVGGRRSAGRGLVGRGDPARRWWTMALIGSCTLRAAAVRASSLPAKDTGWVSGPTRQLGETSRLARAGDHRRLGVDRPARRSTRPCGHLHGRLRRGGGDQRARSGVRAPPAVSGHNNEWFWGPGDGRATTMVAVAPDRWM